jgi:hypothetical protein
MVKEKGGNEIFFDPFIFFLTGCKLLEGRLFIPSFNQ